MSELISSLSDSMAKLYQMNPTYSGLIAKEILSIYKKIVMANLHYTAEGIRVEFTFSDDGKQYEMLINPMRGDK